MIKLNIKISMILGCCLFVMPSRASDSLTIVRQVKNIPDLLWEHSFLVKEQTNKLIGIDVSQDGEKILVADHSGYLYAYDKRGKELWRYKYQTFEGNLNDKNEKSSLIITSPHFTRDASQVVCLIQAPVSVNPVSLEIAEKGTQPANIIYRTLKIVSLDASGQFLWEHDVAKYPPITMLNWAEEGNRIIAASDNEGCGAFFVIDHSGKLIIKLYKQNLNFMGVSPSGKYFYLGHRLYDDKGQKIAELKTSGHFVLEGHFVYVDEKIAVGMDDYHHTGGKEPHIKRKLTAYSLPRMNAIWSSYLSTKGDTFEGYGTMGFLPILSFDGKIGLRTSNASDISIINVKKGNLVRQLSVLGDLLAIAPDFKYGLFSSQAKQRISLIDLKSNVAVSSINPVNLSGYAFSTNINTFAAVINHTKVQVYDFSKLIK